MYAGPACKNFCHLSVKILLMRAARRQGERALDSAIPKSPCVGSDYHQLDAATTATHVGERRCEAAHRRAVRELHGCPRDWQTLDWPERLARRRSHGQREGSFA